MASQQQTIEWLTRQRQRYLQSGLDPNQPDIFHLDGYTSINQLIEEVKNQTLTGRKLQEQM